MADIAVFGTAAADVVARVARIPARGELVSATPVGWRLGGGSANFACAMSAAGHRVQFVGPFGGDRMATVLRDALRRRGVRTDHALHVDARSPRAMVLLDPSGERTILTFDHDFSTQVYPLHDVPAVPDADGVYVETYARFPATIADRMPDALVLLSPPTADAGRWPADVIVGSEREFPDEWAHAPYTRARALAGHRLRWVVVTRGARGAEAYGPDDVVRVDAKPAQQEDATGAGDAFAAGLLSALLSGDPIDAALRTATESGTANVQMGGMLSTAPIEALVSDLL